MDTKPLHSIDTSRLRQNCWVGSGVDPIARKTIGAMIKYMMSVSSGRRELIQLRLSFSFAWRPPIVRVVDERTATKMIKARKAGHDKLGQLLKQAKKNPRS